MNRAGRVTLSQTHTSLSLFAEAMAGRPVAIEALDADQRCWPWTPSALGRDDLAVPATLGDRASYRTIVVHQVARAEEAPTPVRLPIGEPQDPALFTRVLAMLEDQRIDAAVRRRYPGAIFDLDRLLGTARAEIGPEARGLLGWLWIGSLGADDTELDAHAARLPPDHRALVPRLAEVARSVEVESATVDTSVVAALEICRLLASLGASGATAVAEVASPDGEPAVPGSEPVGVSLDADGTPDEVESSDQVDGGRPAADLDESAAEQLRKKRENERAGELLGMSIPAGRSADRDGGRTFVYDEWDYRVQRHRVAWCRLLETRLHGDDHAFIADVRHRHGALRSRIRRRFARLRPADLVRVHRSDDGDELDLDAVIEMIADRRSGVPVDDRLHVRRDRAARDVATAFLVDLSASTSSPVVAPEASAAAVFDPEEDVLSYAPIWQTPADATPVRRVIDVARDAVALMGDALHELGDQHAIYGFSGSGRHKVEFVVAKDFDDGVSPGTWAALAEMRPRHYTRMGPAIRHATTKLHRRSARSKLLIVISDGYPQDTDYGDDRRDRDYGIHDTARALDDARRAGIDTFCVTIDPAGHDYLRRMCPDNRYLVIEDVESLPEELAKLYLNLAV